MEVSEVQIDPNTVNLLNLLLGLAVFVVIVAVVALVALAWFGYNVGKRMGKEKRLSLNIRLRPDGNFYLNYVWGLSDFGKTYTASNLTKEQLKELLGRLIDGTKWEAS